MVSGIGCSAVMLLQAGGALGGFAGLPLLLVFFVGMYFLLVLPNQRKQKKWQEMLGQLKTGDTVTTNAGMRGTVVALREDTVVLKLQPDNIKLEFVRSAIAAVTPAGEA